jgi:hypothetical protein
LYLKTFAYENENNYHRRTRTQAVADARNFDVISAASTTYRDHIPAMLAANPDLIVVAYLNGTFAQETESTAFPSSWYSRDRNGLKITSLNYGNYLMDPSVAGWRDNRVARCRSLLVSTGYQGCMVDMLGSSPIKAKYATGVAINKATGSEWTVSTWQQTTASLVTQIQAEVPGAVVWGNGYGSGDRYFENEKGPTRTLSPGIAGGVTESWIRTASMGVNDFRSEADWKQSVDMLVDLGATGEATAAMVKLWSAGTVAEKDRYLRYGLASFLLGSDGRSSFWASYDRNADALAKHPYLSRVDIGAPRGPYSRVDGAYQRVFDTGKVVVNPTSTSRTIDLGGSYIDLRGTARRSVTLGPYSGDVFRKQ